MGASTIDGFAAALEERLGLPVEPFDAFRKITCDASKLRIDNLPKLLPTVAVAVGLALRKAGDR